MAAAFGENGDRTSSRVIKPPGGGHSDIFGLYNNTEPKHHVRYNQPKSQISEVFSYDDENKKTEPNNMKEENEKDNDVEKKIEEKKENGTNENEAPKPNPPQRARVPPGGFSSALW